MKQYRYYQNAPGMDSWIVESKGWTGWEYESDKRSEAEARAYIDQEIVKAKALIELKKFRKKSTKYYP